MATLKASPATPILPLSFLKGVPLKTQSNAQKLLLESLQECRCMGIWKGVPFDFKRSWGSWRRALVCWSAPVGGVGLVRKGESEHGQNGYLVKEFGWGVRRMVEFGDEMRGVAQVQGEAFHVPVALFNDLFFEFFKAEVLSALMYRIRNSPKDRYACLVAESINEQNSQWAQVQGPVGIVDATVQNEEDVLSHLKGVKEYLYVSGIAVLAKYRRQKIATVLLKACDALSCLWGFDNLALRAYEDDSAARRLYSNAGYRVVSSDPSWMTWVGRKRRVLMIKSSVKLNIL